MNSDGLIDFKPIFHKLDEFLIGEMYPIKEKLFGFAIGCGFIVLFYNFLSFALVVIRFKELFAIFGETEGIDGDHLLHKGKYFSGG